MMLRRYLSFLLLSLSAVLFLNGCGDAGGSADQNKGEDPDGPEGPVIEPPEPNGTAVDVRVEGTAGIAGTDSIIAQLLQAVLPAQAMALANQKEVKVSEIRIVRVNHNGEIITSSPITIEDYSVDYDQPDGSHKINFSRTYTARIDLLIEAELANGIVLRRPLPNTVRNTDKQPYVINVATEYALRDFFETVDDEAFLKMLPCESGTLSCENQAEMKLINWLAMFEGAVDFEIAVPEDLDLDAALTFLGTKVSFTRFVDKSIDTLLVDKIGGQSGLGIIPDPLKAVIGTYNAVSFGMGLNQGLPGSGAETAVLSNWVSTEATFSNSSGETKYYPYVTVSNLGATIVSTLLTGDIPLLRNSLTQDAATSFIPDLTASPADRLAAERNFLGVTGTFTSLTTFGFYDYGVLQTQAITGKGTTEFTGWLTNPYFSSLYDASAQSSMLDARVTNGLAVELSGSSVPYNRGSIREELNTFSFIAYSKRKEDKPETAGDEFTTAVINEKQYGVISLTQQFSDGTANPPLQIRGAIHHWNAATTANIAESQPAPGAGDIDLYHTWTMSRSNSNLPTAPTASSGTAINRGYQAIASELYDKTIGTYDSFTGRIEINTNGDVWQGMSEPNGELLSFAINTVEEGQGVAHAMRLQTSGALTPLQGETYRLVGNGFGMTAAENRLFHIDNSRLEFNTDGTVSLTLNQVKATQDVSSLEVSELLANDATITPDPIIPLFGAGTVKNSIRMDFGTLTLEGFVSIPGTDDQNVGGRMMILLLRQGDSLGLVYAFREKNLTVE